MFAGYLAGSVFGGRTSPVRPKCATHSLSGLSAVACWLMMFGYAVKAVRLFLESTQ